MATKTTEELIERRRRCRSDDDFIGALYELAIAIAIDDRLPDVPSGNRARGNARGPGFDPDGFGYQNIARRALEECR